MEKKTIGQFIATLRKANGMTQRQLADKLNVSDKAVSRWERDESAPDLTLIPVLAEVFGVTSDEILRGERKNIEAEESPRAVEKTEKQLANMLSSVQHKLNMRNIIVVGIAVVGLIVAMLCNCALYRASLGFYLACAFYLVAAICETIFTMQTFNSLSNSDYDGSQVGMCRRRMLGNVEYVYSIIVAVFVFTLPLAMFSLNANEGMELDFWFRAGASYVVVAIFLCITVVVFINSYFVNKLGLSEEDKTKELRLFKCRRKYYLIGVIFSIVIIGGELLVLENLSPADVISGKTFTNLDDYVEYMETPLDEYIEGDIFFSESYIIEVENEHGIKEEMGFVYGADGKTVLAKYTLKNKSVMCEKYAWDDDTLKSITVYTRVDYHRGQQIIELLTIAFKVALVVELVTVIVLYKKKSLYMA